MSAYIGDVVKNGLVLYLDAANRKSYVSGSSTWFDLSGNNNSGTLINGPTFSSEYKGYITCDGTNDYIEVLNSTSLRITGSSNLTCEYWFMKLATTTGFDNIWGVNKWRTGGAPGTNEWSLSIGNGSSANGDWYEFVVESTTNTIYFVSSNGADTLQLNKWYQMVGVRNGAYLQVYIDGVLKLDQQPSGFSESTLINNANRNLRINNSGNDFFYTNANNAIVRVYNRALSPAEILENYNATKGRFDTPIVINSVQPRLVTNGLVMCLDAGNRESYVSGSSTIFDLSGTGNHGTLNNGPTFSSANNGSIVFDGTNDFISTTNSVNNPQTYTVAAWFKTSTGGGKKIIGFESSQVGAGGNYDRMLYIGANNKIYFGQYINGTVVAVSPSTYNDNIWHYIVGTYGSEGTTMRLYVDGVSVATAAASSAQNYTGWWKIGGINLNSWINGVNGYYTGNIAAAHVYNRGLSASEVLQNYNALKGRFGL